MALYNCEIKFKDEETIFETLVKYSLDIIEEDDSIFFYCNGVHEIEALTKEDNGEDFIVLTYSKYE